MRGLEFSEGSVGVGSGAGVVGVGVGSGYARDTALTRLLTAAQAAAGIEIPDGHSGGWHALRHYSATRYGQAGATTRALMTRYGQPARSSIDTFGTKNEGAKHSATLQAFPGRASPVPQHQSLFPYMSRITLSSARCARRLSDVSHLSEHVCRSRFV